MFTSPASRVGKSTAVNRLSLVNPWGNQIVPPHIIDFDVGWINQTTTTATDGQAGISLFGNSNSGINMLVRTAPTAPYKINLLINFFSTDGIGAPLVALGWRDGSSGKLDIAAPQSNNDIVHKEYSDPSTLSSYDTVTPLQVIIGPIWYQIADDGTNITISAPGDGINFFPYYTVAKSSGYLGTSGYNQIVFGIGPANFTTLGTLLSWLQI